MAELRRAPGRERAPGTWELIVEAGRDPVTGRSRQVSRTFHATLREAKTARAELVVEVGKGRHTGTAATVDQLYDEWILELRRKGRSPNTIYGYELVYKRNIRPTLGKVPVTKVNTKMLTDLYGAHQGRGLAARSVHQIHACLSSMFTQACRWGWRDTNPTQWAEPPSLPNVGPSGTNARRGPQTHLAAEQSRRPEYARALLVASTAFGIVLAFAVLLAVTASPPSTSRIRAHRADPFGHLSTATLDRPAHRRPARRRPSRDIRTRYSECHGGRAGALGQRVTVRFLRSALTHALLGRVPVVRLVVSSVGPAGALLS